MKIKRLPVRVIAFSISPPLLLVSKKKKSYLCLSKTRRNMNNRIRIKDIAEQAGVSVGTVDRILHERPNVSKKAREKVEKVLKEIDYKPNAYASALAYNKTYNFYMLMPKHESEAYWQEIEQGAKKATEARRDFHVELNIIFFERFNQQDFTNQYENILRLKPDGVIIVPTTLQQTQQFTDQLHNTQTPFVMLDSYMPDLKPLAFFGQDSFSSGYFAAKVLMMVANKEKEIMLMKQTINGKVTSKQQANREVGFRHYMADHFPQVKITELELPHEAQPKTYAQTLEKFFQTHKDIHHCITLNSKAYIVGEFLLKTNRRNVQIMGYDMVTRNAECLRLGSISFLIAQHAYQQGYASVNALFQAIVLKKKVAPVNYMPIELIMKENVEFYRRTQL